MSLLSVPIPPPPKKNSKNPVLHISQLDSLMSKGESGNVSERFHFKVNWLTCMCKSASPFPLPSAGLHLLSPYSLVPFPSKFFMNMKYNKPAMTVQLVVKPRYQTL